MNKSQNVDPQFKEFLLKLPKTEIHLHLEGMATVDTIWSLIQDNNLDYPNIKTKEDLKKEFQVNSLDEFISLFINVIQNAFKKENDIKYLIKDAREYLERNNIFHAEIFFAPTKFIQNGFDFAKMITILDEGAAEILNTDKRTIKYIIDVSRSFGPENAMNNLNMVLDNPKSSVIGIGLGGAELHGPARDYIEVFKKAKEEGLHVVAHAGEDVDAYSVWDSVKLLNAERIGHGISSIQDEDLMSYLHEKQIALEVCPTSNLFTKHFVKKIQDHPIKPFFDRGLNVTLNSDDPTLFGSELLNEYIILLESGLFTPGDLLKLLKNTHFASFMEESQKIATWIQIEKLIKKSSWTITE